jgi:hypothetical protein
MEERYPIKFSLGQFVILLGIFVVVLSLVFFLGARFGGLIFPEYYAKQFEKQGALASLAPGTETGRALSPSRASPLVDTPEEEGDEADEEADAEESDIPHYQVGADGSLRPQEENTLSQQGEEEPHPSESFNVNKGFIQSNVDKNTVVRFKSSGYSKFTVEVADYFDELLASRKITQLKRGGYEAYLHIKNPNTSSPTFSVRVGAFFDRKDAESFATEMSNKQNLELRVVQMN